MYINMSFLSFSNYDIYNVLFYFILKTSTVGLTVLIPTVLAWEEMQSSPYVRLSVSVLPFHSSSSLVFSYIYTVSQKKLCQCYF